MALTNLARRMGAVAPMPMGRSGGYSPSQQAAAAVPQRNFAASDGGDDVWGNVSDPFAEIQQKDPSGYSRFMNPGGDPELYKAIAERAARASMARRRSALLSARARSGGNPSMYGYAAMQADRQGQSDLSGALSDATERSVGANRQYREGLQGRAFDAIRSRDEAYRGFKTRGMDREHDYKIQLDMMRRQAKMKKRNPISVGFGGASISF